MEQEGHSYRNLILKGFRKIIDEIDTGKSFIFAAMNTSPASSISKAMIFAAGLGTRFKPWTDRHPKALAMVNGKSLLQRNIEYLQQYGIRDLVINGWGSHITISDETNEVLETGGGLKKAGPLLEGGPFLVMNVDILTDLDLSVMIKDHFQHRPLATLAVTSRKTSRYFLFDERQQLCGWRNVRTGEERMARRIDTSPVQKAFSGIHIIDPGIFPLIGEEGKFSIVDLYLRLAASREIRGFDHSHSRLIDVGKPESAQEAARWFF
jgi:MurNAc alpha-1-phosphate uridylyltransferase